MNARDDNPWTRITAAAAAAVTLHLLAPVAVVVADSVLHIAWPGALAASQEQAESALSDATSTAVSSTQPQSVADLMRALAQRRTATRPGVRQTPPVFPIRLPMSRDLRPASQPDEDEVRLGSDNGLEVATAGWISYDDFE